MADYVANLMPLHTGCRNTPLDKAALIAQVRRRSAVLQHGRGRHGYTRWTELTRRVSAVGVCCHCHSLVADWYVITPIGSC